MLHFQATVAETDGAPEIVRVMADASLTAGVDPMAAVAGAVEAVGTALIR